MNETQKEMVAAVLKLVGQMDAMKRPTDAMTLEEMGKEVEWMAAINKLLEVGKVIAGR